MNDIAVRFWGVRGSIACPESELARYGGNTACVEVRCGNHLLVFDGGTGLRSLGNALVKGGLPVDADILLSHCHLDHVCGLPFFAPFYVASARLRLWCGNLMPEYKIEEVLRTIMAEPLFPAGIEVFAAKVEFRDFHAGDVLQPSAGLTLRTALLNHPGRATGYRVEYGGSAIAYITDTEHHSGRLDENVLRLAAGANLMIYDCNYTDEEWPSHVGRGHSTWQEGMRLAEAAEAKVLAVFHHDPGHDDRFLDRVSAEASTRRPGTVVASEGMTLHV
jgi:phosphoribosyl 1,2-cyclic phosphodiesterase